MPVLLAQILWTLSYFAGGTIAIVIGARVARRPQR